MAWRPAAGEAVRHATNPDPLAAALDAVDRARLAFAVDDRADFCGVVHQLAFDPCGQEQPRWA